MSNNKYLLLWLESPLQSWGFDSKFDRRDTLDFPTKSGVMGLLCCAMGAKGEQREFLNKMASLSQNVIAYNFGKYEPMLMDYHMVGNGYDEKDPWEKLLIPKTSDGKKPVGTGVKQTFRYYIQDAAFAVTVEIPSEYSSVIYEALQQPVFDIFLGRKCCIPTDFVFRGIFDSAEEADNRASEIAKSKNRQEAFRVTDGKNKDGDPFIINDVPLCFGQHKEYKDRFVTKI